MATVESLPTVSPAPTDYLIIEKAGGGTSKATIADAALQGATGPAGSPGAKGADGHTPVLYSGKVVTGTADSVTAEVPSAVTGDIYLNTDTGNLYGCTGTNTWHYVGCIKGPAGDKGDTGAPGANGTNGAAGPQGPAGVLDVKTLDNDAMNKTPGSFIIKGSSSDPAGNFPTANADWVGIQLDAGNDTVQILASGGTLVVRQNDSGVKADGSTSFTGWKTLGSTPDLSKYVTKDELTAALANYLEQG